MTACRGASCDRDERESRQPRAGQKGPASTKKRLATTEATRPQRIQCIRQKPPAVRTSYTPPLCPSVGSSETLMDAREACDSDVRAVCARETADRARWRSQLEGATVHAASVRIRAGVHPAHPGKQIDGTTVIAWTTDPRARPLFTNNTPGPSRRTGQLIKHVNLRVRGHAN